MTNISHGEDMDKSHIFISVMIVLCILSGVFAFLAINAVATNESEYSIAWEYKFPEGTFIRDISWSPDSEKISITRGSESYPMSIFYSNGTQLNCDSIANLSAPILYYSTEWSANSELLAVDCEAILVSVNITTGDRYFLRQPYFLDFPYGHISYNTQSGFLAFVPTYYGNSTSDSNIYYNGTNVLHGPIEIMNITTHQTVSIINPYPHFNQWINKYLISPSGEKIAMNLQNGSVIITDVNQIDNLNINSTLHKFTLLNDSRKVLDFAWSPDSSRIVTVFDDNATYNENPTTSATIWNAETGNKIYGIAFEDASICTSVDWNSQNSIIVTSIAFSSQTQSTLFIMDGIDGTIQQVIDCNVNDWHVSRGYVTTSPNNEYLAVSFGSTLLMFDKNTQNMNEVAIYTTGAVVFPLGTFTLLIFRRKKGGKNHES